jgi:hypothetical protein
MAMQRDEKKRTAKTLAPRLRAIGNTNPVISDELGRREIAMRMKHEMDLGFDEMSCVGAVARQMNETPATVISVWKSVRR